MEVRKIYYLVMSALAWCFSFALTIKQNIAYFYAMSSFFFKKVFFYEIPPQLRIRDLNLSENEIIFLQRRFQKSSKLSKYSRFDLEKGAFFPPSHKATAGQAAVTIPPLHKVTA